MATIKAKENFILDKAKDYINKAEYHSAEIILKKTIHRTPAESGYLLGVVEYQNNNHRKAKKHFISALTHGNMSTELLHAVSTVELAMGKPCKAIKYSSQAIRNNSKDITSINHHATIQIAAEKTADAIISLRRSLRIFRNQPPIKLALAALYERSNKPHEAIPLIKEIFEANPCDFEIAKHLANLYSSTNASRRAANIYRKFLRIEAHQKAALSLLLASLSSMGKHRRILNIISAIGCQIPFDEQLLATKINALNSLGQHTNAMSCILSDVDSLQSHSGFLRILDETIDQSGLGTAELIELLVQFQKNGYAKFKLGKLASDAGDYDVALRHFINALTFIPGLLEAHFEAFRLLSKSGNKLGALALIAKSERLFEKSPIIDFLKGYAHYLTGHWDTAVDYLNSCLNQEPGNCKANSLLGDIYEAFNDPKRALQYYKIAFDSDESYELLAGKLAHGMLKMCDWSNLDNISKAATTGTLKHGGICHPFNAHSLCDDAEFHRICSERFHPILVPPQMPKYPPTEYPATRRKKIRVAYISSDFRTHPVAHHMLGILRNHSRENFEIYTISLSNENSSTQKQIIQASEKFSSIEFLSEASAISFLRNLDLDIAVDLNGNTGESRTNLFKNRIARIQINYLGFLGTMGCDFMDYIIADRTLIPETDQKHYSEKVIYLKSYLCNAPAPEQINPPQRADFQLPSEGFIFASFNNTYKINPLVLSCWSEILKGTKNSFLWTYIKHDEAKENFLREAKNRGIDTNQIIFANFAPYEEHLNRHQLADLYLDTFPYNAGATAGNALKMGLPMVTLAGNSFPSRYGASLLESVQLSELVCKTPDDYVKSAIALTEDNSRLAAIKELLARNLMTSISFNPNFFTRNLEEAFAIAMANYFSHTKGHIYT